MSQVHRFTVPDEQSGNRLDRCIADLHGQWSRSRVRRLIDDQHVLLNDRPAKPSMTVQAGDSIEVSEPPPAPLDLAAEDTTAGVRLPGRQLGPAELVASVGGLVPALWPLDGDDERLGAVGLGGCGNTACRRERHRACQDGDGGNMDVSSHLSSSHSHSGRWS